MNRPTPTAPDPRERRANAVAVPFAAMMLALTLSTNVAGRVIARTGRYKAFPVAGLATMTVALVFLAIVAGHPSRTTTAIGLTVFGLGFGVVGQVLTVAVQNEVDRRQIGVAMAATTFFRGLGGAIGAAVLGAVFAARAGTTGNSVRGLGSAARADVIDAVQTVFIVAAPIAALALAVVLLLRERPLETRQRAGAPRGQPAGARA